MEKADILEMTVSYLQSRCLAKTGQPDIAEARLTSQLSTPYQPHSRPQHYVQATTLAQLPGTTPVRPRDMTRSSNAHHRRSVYVTSDSAIPLYVDATPVMNRTSSRVNSPNGSHCSDDSPSCSPGGSTTCSPPSILSQAPLRREHLMAFSPTSAHAMDPRSRVPYPSRHSNSSPMSALPSMTSAWRPW